LKNYRCEKMKNLKKSKICKIIDLKNEKIWKNQKFAKF
jgi:hypothetical protein